MNKRLLFMTEAAMIASLYIVLTLLVQPIATGPIQFRVSEALMLLPALLPAAVPGLYLGCVLANVLLGLGWIDIVFGALATLLAGLLTRYMAGKFGLRPDVAPDLRRQELVRRPRLWILPLPSVVFNALIVGFYLPILMPPESGAFWTAMVISMAQLAISEAVVVFTLGVFLFLGLYPFTAKRTRRRA